jgi:hypothetical protein
MQRISSRLVAIIMMNQWKIAVCMALLAALGLNTPASRALTNPPEGWHAADPGFAAQVLLGRGNSMWAAGSGEAIAVSSDAGRHWALKHHDAKGALLLVLQFVDDRFGYAAGTGGKVLFTEDGGETWSSQRLAEDSILQAAFGDPRHGVIRTLWALLSTTDGGKNWLPIAPANDADWLNKFPYTVGLAALDKDHLAVRMSEGEFSDGEYLWTADGGATWAANYLPNVGIHDLFAAGRTYFSIGHEVLGKDKPGGGYGVAMSFRSRDGVSWEHVSMANGVCKNEECGGCTSQGCFAGKDSAVDLDNGQSWMAKFPVHEGLSNQWARSGDTLCLLSRGSVECAAIEAVRSLDAGGDNPAWESRSLPRLGAVPRSSPQCIRCQFPPILVTRTGDSGPIDFQFSFTLEPAGQIDDVMIVGKVPRDVIDQIRALTGGWLFEPILENGVPIRKSMGMRGRLMIMNPDKPGPGMLSPAKPQ